MRNFDSPGASCWVGCCLLGCRNPNVDSVRILPAFYTISDADERPYYVGSSKTTTTSASASTSTAASPCQPTSANTSTAASPRQATSANTPPKTGVAHWKKVDAFVDKKFFFWLIRTFDSVQRMIGSQLFFSSNSKPSADLIELGSLLNLFNCLWQLTLIIAFNLQLDWKLSCRTIVF